jgi:hypothetical protein
MVKRPDVQQALLKPGSAALYPGVPANEWYPVAMMLELVGTAKRRMGAQVPAAEQLLDPEHFSFRGTASAGSKEADREGRSAGRKRRGQS